MYLCSSGQFLSSPGQFFFLLKFSHKINTNVTHKFLPKQVRNKIEKIDYEQNPKKYFKYKKSFLTSHKAPSNYVTHVTNVPSHNIFIHGLQSLHFKLVTLMYLN